MWLHLHVLVEGLPVPLPEEAEGDALASQAALQALLRLTPLSQQAPPVGQRCGLAVGVPSLHRAKGGREAAGSTRLSTTAVR